MNSNVLLVEGKDDYHVIYQVCTARGVKINFKTEDCEGNSSVLEHLEALIFSSDRPNVVGVILDVDGNEERHTLQDRWQQIRSRVEKFGYNLPRVPNVKGTIIRAIDSLPQLGFWLMPNNHDIGKLEDFLMEMADQDAIASARACVQSAIESKVARFNACDLSKAVVYTYLAWQREPGRPLGLAVKMKALEPTTPNADNFLAWINNLYSL